MKLNRFLASFINGIFGIINFILLFFNKAPLGNMFFGGEWFESKGMGERFVFGLLTVIIFGTMLGWIVNIYFWATDQDSIPVMLTKMIFK